LLHIPIEKLLSNTVVKYVLQYVPSTPINDAIFVIIGLGAIYFFVTQFKRYGITASFFYILFILLSSYIVYRFFYPAWNFTSFSIWEEIKYLDIIIFLGVLSAIVVFFKCTIGKKKTLSKNSLFEDNPIVQVKNDKLGYGEYASIIASKVKSSHFKNSFAIGINGKWGAGKTSFMNFIKADLKDEDIIEIDFSPWSSNSSQLIVQDFFETVQENISRHHSSFSRLLRSYSNKLVSLKDNSVAQSIQTSIHTLSGFESLGTLLREINEALIKIDKKLVIYIDDLDRLDYTEIVEVIRLIRNTANFHNTFFIVAYDRSYIVSALKKHNSFNKEQFLEKIFQIEVTLPLFETDVFRHKLLDSLKEKLPLTIHSELESIIIGTPSEFPYYLNVWLDSMRDVSRLSNILTINFTRLKGEVDLSDLINLELLHIKYPSIYIELHKQKSYFFDQVQSAKSSESRFVLRKEPRPNGSTGSEQYVLEDYLKANAKSLFIPKSEVKKVFDFISTIFSDSLLWTQENHLSVVFLSKFNRYFAYSLLSGLSENEFNEMRKSDQETFHKAINKWIDEGLETDLRNRFSDINSYNDKDDYEKIIKAIFYLANQKSKKDKSPRGIVAYDGKNLCEKLNPESTIKNYYPGDDGKEKFKKFVEEQLKASTAPFLFEADFIRFSIRQYFDLPLSHDELLDIRLDYFKQYCSIEKKLTSDTWYLYHCCITKYETKTGEQTSRIDFEVDPKANKALIGFVEKDDLNAFILDIIQQAPFDKLFAVSNAIPRIFEYWDAFYEFIYKQDEKTWDYLPEFKEFLEKFKATTYSQYVDFSFKKIPVIIR
jgi:hypothetical protein